MLLRLCNPAPRELRDVPSIVDGHPVLTEDGLSVLMEQRYVDITPSEEECITEVEFPADVSVREAVATVLLPDGVWERHSGAQAPLWLSSNHDLLAASLADEFGCPITPWSSDEA